MLCPKPKSDFWDLKILLLEPKSYEIVALSLDFGCLMKLFEYIEEVILLAVKIRLRRMGAKKTPFYRIVVADSRYPRDGRFIEEIGFYNPLKDPAEVKVDSEKAKKWMSNGAQPTDTVKALFKKHAVL